MVYNTVAASSPLPKVNSKKDVKKRFASVSDHIVTGCIALSAVSPIRYIKVVSSEILGRNLCECRKHNDIYKNVLENALECTGLKDKGVSIHNWQMITFDIIDELCKEIELKYGFWGKRDIPKLRRRFEAYMKGTNASFSSHGNFITVNIDRAAIIAFHEMGHALNYNDKGFTRLLQKSRKLSSLAPVIMLIAAFTPAKTKDEKPKNIIDKGATFVKNNAGKLAFATIIPMLAEEILASCRANKIANSIFSDKSLVKNINKTNALGAMSYLAVAVSAGLSARGASWVHDKIETIRKKTNNIYVINPTLSEKNS